MCVYVSAHLMYVFVCVCILSTTPCVSVCKTLASPLSVCVGLNLDHQHSPSEGCHVPVLVMGLLL